MEDYQIFISYRRTGGADFAARVSDRLKGFGYHVFFDIESMNSGGFDEQIFTALDQCEDVVVILPPNGLDRCEDEEDWVRGEIARSIKNGKNIVPVLMPGFEFPKTLPGEIARLPFFEGVKYFNEYFDATIERIKALLHSKPLTEDERPRDIDADFDAGVRFLNYKMYDKSISCLEKALLSDLSNPDIYFFLAIASLGGKRPFLVQKSKITEIEQYINTAIDIESKPIYLYLLAYIKYDFYFNKRLNSDPRYDYLLDLAAKKGLTQNDKKMLFGLLDMPIPEGF